MLPIKTSFAAGELSPHLWGRVDMNQYLLGCRMMKNFFCHTQGGASNRAGTEFLFNCDFGVESSTSHSPRLIPFVFSTGDTVLCIFNTNGRIYFIQDGEVVGGGTPTYNVHPYAAADLFEVNYVQSGDILYMVHRDYEPIKISRIDDSPLTFQVAVMDFEDGPYADPLPGDSEMYIHPGWRTGFTGMTSDTSFFEQSMVGLPFRLGYQDNDDPTDIDWGWGYIYAVQSATEATISIQDPIGYELVFNTDFSSSTNGWQDNSTGTRGGTDNKITYDGNNLTVTIYHTADGYGRISQDIDYWPSRSKVTCSIKATISAGASMRFFAGTAYDNSDYIKERVYPGDEGGNGYFNFEFTTPKTDKNFTISIDNRYTADGDTVIIEEVVMSKSDLSTNIWRRPAWAPAYEIGNVYPGIISFHEQRMILASTHYQPQTVWHTRTANFKEWGFSTPTLEDDGFNYTVASRKIDRIEWIETGPDLMIGTYSNIYRVTAGSQADAITPLSLSVRPQVGDGCGDIAPLKAGNSTLVVARGNKQVYDLAYSLETDGYRTNDVTVLSNHLFEFKRIKSWDYANLPDTIVWCVMDSGDLYGMTYRPDQQVAGWHRHDTKYGWFKDVCVLPTSTSDDVYFVVERFFQSGTNFYKQNFVEKLKDRIHLNLFSQSAKLNAEPERIIGGIGRTQRTIEQTYIDEGGINDGTGAGAIGHEIDPHQYWFVDSGREYISPGQTLTGLAHLEGHELAVFANGSVLAPLTVSNGSITLDRDDYYRVIVGLPILARLEINEFELSNPATSTIGRTRAISRIVANLYRSRSFYASALMDERFEEVKLRDEFDTSFPVKLRTGTVELSVEGGWQNGGGIIIEVRDPTPLTILNLIPEVEIAPR